MRPKRSVAPTLALVLAVLTACAGCGAPEPEADTPARAATRPETPPPASEVDTWARDLLAWRHEREERLRAEYGWLSLVGLDWLEPGVNTVGADPSSTVRLPAAVAPGRVATLIVDGDRVRLLPEPGVPLTVDGEPATARDVATDADPAPDTFQIEDLRFRVIRRGDRIGVRTRWPRASTRIEFAGLEWYPPDRSYRVEGRLEPFDEPTEVPIPNVLGESFPTLSPGRVRFAIAGREVTLLPTVDEPGATELFFVFRDSTSGETTYPGGRFLYADLEPDGTVTLDFNRAYSPPCAFTPYATCPLPPRENRLDLAIEAGERFAGH